MKKISCGDGEWALVCKPYAKLGREIFCLESNPAGNEETLCDVYTGAFASYWDYTTYCEGEGTATAGPSYPSWDPDAAITLVNGVYEVDSALIELVRTDMNVIIDSDTSRFEWLSTGYGKLTNISSSDMAHHLGFQNDDVLLSISDGVTGSINLNAWADYVEAAFAYASETSLSVTVQRGSSNVTLDYSIL